MNINIHDVYGCDPCGVAELGPDMFVTLSHPHCVTAQSHLLHHMEM